MGRLIIVSNRLPLTVSQVGDEVEIIPSIGGLATGLRGPQSQRHGLWIGWPGDLFDIPASHLKKVHQKLHEADTVPVALTRSQVRGFYEGFSNGVLWPLFHYLTDVVDKNASSSWQTYVEVNRIFADAVVERYRHGDTVWVHDFQLLLVPGMLRQRLPEATIGFFLHIPFPSSEVFRILPWRRELLRGMLGADLIGFHTQAYLRHFTRALLMVLGHDAQEESVICDGRRVQLGVFPMGIDAARFAHEVESDEVVESIRSIREKAGGQRLVLGIDRLDYTKGIPRRLLAIDRLLEKEPEWREKLHFVQVVVPCRSGVPSYQRLRKELDELIGRINGKHATVSWVPVHNLSRALSRNELVSMYAACDAILVTPLRDGMNLIAKEFVATRKDEDGVLILSEFAGVAAELGDAIQVNPYDVDGVADTIGRALRLPREDRERRMQRMRARVFGYDAYRWADDFLADLDAARLSRTPSSGLRSLQPVISAAMRADRLIVMLDYDGTLVPYASEPHLAPPDGLLLDLLEELAASPGTEVHIVSGRAAPSLEHWLGHLPLYLHAEHGFWSRRPGSEAWVPLHPPCAPWKEAVSRLMASYVSRTPGTLVEEKDSSVAWHYRNADSELGATHARQLAAELEPWLVESSLEVLRGSRVVEVRVKGTHKGVICQHLSAEAGTACLVALGDDRTDEDMFAALPASGFAVHVGPGLSRAAIRLADYGAARELLEMLLALRPARPRISQEREDG